MTDRTPEQDDARRRVDAALAGMLQEPAPVDGQLREQIKDALWQDCIGYDNDRIIDTVLPVVSAAIAEAKAEALEEIAPDISNRYGDREQLLARAAEYRTPKEG